MPEKNARTWNSMIGACIQHGHSDEAMQTFYGMQLEGIHVTDVTVIVVLGACTSDQHLDFGKRIQKRVSEGNHAQPATALQNSLVNMYAKCGCLEAAKKSFDEMEQDTRSVVSWNAMISAYIQNSRDVEALELYKQMCQAAEPDSFTFSSVLTACSNLNALEEGKLVHHQVEATGMELDGVLGSALITMYGKCEDSGSARLVFEKLVEEQRTSMDVVCWNAMISAYSQCGCSSEAFELFYKMDLEGIKQVSASFVSILAACNSFDKGMALELRLASAGLDTSQEIGAALINMHSRCGNLDRARRVFDSMVRINDVRALRNPICWTAMLAAYSHHGCARQSLELLFLMSLEGVQPNEINFTSILNACSHAGLSSQAWTSFLDMHTKYGVAPAAQHLVCLSDMLGRAGMLGEAEAFIGTSTYDDTSTEAEFAAVAWKSLLNACKLQGNAGAGARVAEKLAELEPEVSAPYILLAGIYAAQT
ncbi:pentatricopeptide repeat-containing protein At2g13600 [Selaginella moellendorffii]|uniref:pentatricopeptide repeat-containing protein At2g13600 n=1 Tax=Selaginella moellendorffii TaxID=88036 RepID=UPI000D1CAAD0|nr:pentatricopeptide repeat-containing protein At2g13600 [Selaginella moellendorffii]|eukprot:XP_024522299.1 pentatricopeptide repeat-containing protein At2g13600 [Selaginella moellendorffii]